MTAQAHVGFVMLAHTNLQRAAAVARHWAEGGAPVAIHLDRAVSEGEHAAFVRALADLDNVVFPARRYRCEWGTFGLVEATQETAALLLERFPEITHVYLASGACLPLKPLSQLNAYLARHPQTDFIESVTTEEVVWTVGGLDIERFTLRFPFSWRKQRRLFDAYVELQRRIGYQRRIPDGLDPHLGSQWWCLTRETLSAILEDPRRQEYERYFRRVWIPDESYFQTIARNHARQIESRSLTLAKFDFLGKPYIFYDDHLVTLQQAEQFVARKIWSGANRLYDTFLARGPKSLAAPPINRRRLDRMFEQADARRTKGRAGLVNQGRFPSPLYHDPSPTAAPYTVLEGFSDLFVDFPPWLGKRVGSRIHGHLFHKAKVEFAGGDEIYEGCLTNSQRLRDYNPVAFLRNLVWNTRGEPQCFMYGPADNQAISPFLSDDPNAHMWIITGAWLVPLFHADLDFERIKKIAARYQKVELAHLEMLRREGARAKARIISLTEFVENPLPFLQEVLDHLSPIAARRLAQAPQMVPLNGFGRFLQRLRNSGMNPYLAGPFPLDDLSTPEREGDSRPRMVR